MSEKELIPNLFRTEFRKIVSVLTKNFGLKHIEVAEDIVSDTFLLASETWGLKGLPENPTAWLYIVAKNKTKDYLKRDNLFTQKISLEIKNNSEKSAELELDLSVENISDSQLQMMFTICHPSIPKESQIALSLRMLCGFGIDEIADAFLTNKENINKRLFRAKSKLKTSNIKIELPNKSEINSRLENVVSTLYLLFNEGYYSASDNSVIRKDLCFEAMRLTHLLIKNEQTNKPFVNALLSLMCFHSSRFDARFTESGEMILYEEQNRDLWNDELIAKGNYYLIESAKGSEVSKYHLEASIAYWHCTKLESKNKWQNILQLYNQLLQIEYSPIVALNRTYALSKAKNKIEAIKEAEKLKLDDNHLYHSLLGELYVGIDDKKALQHLETSLKLAKTKADKIIIKTKIARL
ncbi:MAG: sigma-70 family RNA polymerase sigma factor [Melioribacteraceae bacterium]